MDMKLQPHLHHSGKSTAKEFLCPSCASSDIRKFHQMSNVPVNSVLNIASRDEALQFPRGNISLGFCRHCGFISNTVFDPDLVRYSSDCEESQGYSPTFNAFAKNLASELVEKYDLHHKKIIEIGCGKGEFLRLICSLGQNWGIGFDPAYVPGRGDDQANERLTFVKDYYTAKYANCHGDIICCRMTLEHIFDTSELINMVRHSIGDRKTIVFFQVPNATRILRECAFEDIYYEHCSYFSMGSLARLFRKSGFDLLDLRTAFDDQYILIEAKPASRQTSVKLPCEDDMQLLEDYVSIFEKNYPNILECWNNLLKNLGKDGKRIVIWGSGSKGVSFLTTLSNSNHIEYAVDINPFRQGTFMAGTGQAVVSPKFLETYQPDAVIIMNSVYREEIQHDLKKMNLDPSIFVLGEKGMRIEKNGNCYT
jgi:hypothetical protein